MTKQEFWKSGSQSQPPALGHVWQPLPASTSCSVKGGIEPVTRGPILLKCFASCINLLYLQRKAGCLVLPPMGWVTLGKLLTFSVP